MRPERQHMLAYLAGFTLAEMAIVLLVVGLLLGSVVSTVSTQLEARNIAETQNRLNQIKDALTGFAQANGRLPCPADGMLAPGQPLVGVEQPLLVTNLCPITSGTLPWLTLGVPETDVWGRRYTYKVSSEFSDAVGVGGYSCAPTPIPTVSSFALCSRGTFTVTTRTSSSKAGTTVPFVPVVIISHGKNGYGAYTSDGKQLAAQPIVGDERDNATAALTTIYSREQSPQTNPCSDTTANTSFCEFDDLVAYVPISVLITRMVSAGKLP